VRGDVKKILDYRLKKGQAALWFLGQSGFIFKAGETIIVIDPYLSDSVAKVSPKLTRSFAPPIEPGELRVDVFIATHDHMDHLDPDTVEAYQHKDTTTFVGPRLVCRKFAELGVPGRKIVTVDVGQTQQVHGVKLTGVFTVPNEAAVIDTAGYLIEFANGRSVYHTSDTGMSPLLLQAVPSAEVGLFCINGQWGNLDVEEAAELAARVRPKYAIPHHYDVMALNSKNPETFRYVMGYVEPGVEVVIPELLEAFVW
jgi:L-ascorbate 6-phosphate lactonase